MDMNAKLPALIDGASGIYKYCERIPSKLFATELSADQRVKPRNLYFCDHLAPLTHTNNKALPCLTYFTTKWEGFKTVLISLSFTAELLGEYLP